MSREEEIQDIQNRINALKKRVMELVLLWQRMTRKKSRRAVLYELARLSRGRDASPLDLVNDDLGCAESVSQLIRKVIRFPIVTGTWTLNDILKMDSRFQDANHNRSPGTIIICATGTGNGKIRGHVGILGDRGIIMAADSRDGIWREGYTLGTWKNRYEVKGGFTTHYYALL